MSTVAAYDAKERIREAIDIVDLVGGYISLRRQGRGYVGLCPWHEDSRPSLQVNPERQSWRCWVCNIGGDVFSFLMQREGVDFRQAMTMLAERAGIELESARQRPKAQPGSPEDKATLYQALAWAQQQYHEFLLQDSAAEPGRKYFAQRGISEDSIARFRLGYAPNSWQWLVDRARGTAFSSEVLQAAGLAGRSDKSGRPYDLFRGRVLFPIRDVERRPIAMGGRILPEYADDRTGKYFNSPETMLFSKSEQLYGLDIVKDALVRTKRRDVVVVEGYTDVVMSHQFGLENVVAVLGTALGSRHLRLLRRFADRIILVLDGDEAGQRRTNEILELFVAEPVDLRIMTPPDGLDPCDFLIEHGGEAFAELLDDAVDALEHKIRTRTRDLDAGRDLHAANLALEDILGSLARAPRMAGGSGMDNQLREQQVLVRLAREFQIAEADLRARLKQLRSGQPKNKTITPALDSAEPAITIAPQEAELLGLLTLRPQLVPQALAAIAAEQLPSAPARKIYAVYAELTAAGLYADFARVLTELEDPRLKNVLVTVDGDSHEKAALATQGPEARLESLIQYFVQRRQRQLLREVSDQRVDQEEGLRRVLDLIEHERRRLNRE